MHSPSLINHFYPESAFGGFPDIDGSIAFYNRVNALVRPSFRVIDFGCGRGLRSEDPIPFRRDLCTLRGKVAKVTGIDLDNAGFENPMLDEFRTLDPLQPWPAENASAELVLCDWVVEHVPNPTALFSEASRVLVPGGYLCIRTLNALSYVGIASKLISNKHHYKLVSKASSERRKEDVFPTLYRCNTVFALRRQMETHRFRAAVYGYEPEPTYLQFSKIAFSLGTLHQRLAPPFLRVTVHAFGQALE